MSGILYLVATPIGNLEDITLRALRILREADLIAAEDTRVTRKLLSHFDIHTHMTAYNQHSKGQRVDDLLERLRGGENIALVSDAGTPGISDPGYELAKLAISDGISVVPLPGACAAIAALTVSGLPTAGFVFEGFPPRKESERRAFFDGLKNEIKTICLYEAPTRLVATLKSLKNEMGDRHIVLARELTKLFEEIFRGTVQQALDKYASDKPKGEFVIIIEGASMAQNDTPEDASDSIMKNLRKFITQGMSDRDAIRQCAVEMHIPRKQVYSLFLEHRDELSS